MFQRNIRFHVEICTVKSNDSSLQDTYYVTFTLITGKKDERKSMKISFLFAGQARRFKKLCEEIQTLFLNNKDRLAKQRRQINNTNHVSTTNRPPTASFISSLFNNTSKTAEKNLRLIILMI
jgi:hypothetical protein